jgi:ribosome-associated toxin RatA of RatAB toxin-antitoxin module
MKKKLYVSQIEDLYVQQNMKAISDIFSNNPFLKGQWRFLTFQVANAGTTIKFQHNFNFTPADVIVTSVIGGTITFKYEQFDKDFIVFDATLTVATTPMTVRAIIGKYTEETVNV